jgi:hypothetical protein
MPIASWSQLAKRWRDDERVVLWKRDAGQGGAPGGNHESSLPIYQPNRDPEWTRRKEKKTMSALSKKKLRDLFEEVGKRDASAQRDFQAAVRAQAVRKACKRGTQPDMEEARIYRRLYSQPGAPVNYDYQTVKQDTLRFAATEAEGQLETIAKRIMQRDGRTYADAYRCALTERPELYGAYVEQIDKGLTYANCPEPVSYHQSGFLSRSEEAEIAKRRAKCEMGREKAYGEDDGYGDEEEEEAPEAEEKRGLQRKAIRIKDKLSKIAKSLGYQLVKL